MGMAKGVKRLFNAVEFMRNADIKRGPVGFYSEWHTLLSKHTIAILNYFIPLSPDMKMRILLSVLHTFLMELVRRICPNIKTSYPWCSLSLFSSLKC